MNSNERINFPPAEKKKEQAPAPCPSVVDVIRHGETEYKEFQDPGFKIDPQSSDFAFDPEHLDLTEAGIKNIFETARRLSEMIRGKGEAVYFISSPQLRALSSLLIIEEVFAQNGIEILNPSWETTENSPHGIKTSSCGLGQIPLKDKMFGKTWLASHKEFGKAHPEVANQSPARVHRLVAATLGKELPELFSKSHEDMASGFKNFLRRAVNIKRYLGEDARKEIGEKRIRIVCVTHEERIVKFAEEALGLRETVGKAQLLEIDPKNLIENNSETEAKVTLFGQGGKADLAQEIKIRYLKSGIEVSKN